jgi:hypothetical protein
MDSIYNTTELTLIAAVGNNPSFGLPGASSQRPRIPQTVLYLGGIFGLVQALEYRFQSTGFSFSST